MPYDYGFGNTTSNGSNLQRQDLPKTSVPVHDMDAYTKAYDVNSETNFETQSMEAQTLHFPLNQSEAYEGRIRFTVHKADAAQIDFNSFLSLGIFDNVWTLFGKFGKGASSSTTDDEDDGPISQTEEDYNQAERGKKQEAAAHVANFTKGTRYKRDPSASIVNMYFPISLQVADNVAYDAPALGLYGAGAQTAMNAGDNVFSSLAAGLSQGFSDLFGSLAGNSNLTEEAARLVALRAAAKLPDGIGNAIRIGAQRRINPNHQALFKGVTNLRAFSFTFDMMATSEEEAKTVEKIIKHFRTEMYPDIIDPSGNNLPLVYKFPNAFDIHFMHRGQRAKIPKLERCFLQGCDVEYGGAGTGFHPDGRPVKITMTLRFIEMRTLNKNDIKKGF
tara:strand:+ start:310 stop:1476 length:1167 start_codon:yes stop_codon:yes gene_type:complete